MIKVLSKVKKTGSELKNMYAKWLSHESVLAFKWSENIYNNLSKNVKTSYLEKFAITGAIGSKEFWIQANPT